MRLDLGERKFFREQKSASANFSRLDFFRRVLIRSAREDLGREAEPHPVAVACAPWAQVLIPHPNGILVV
jgi:hypothetical protein